MSLRVSRLFVQRPGLVALLLLAPVLPTAHAAGWKLPVWSGELHGKLLPLGEGGPKLAWTFTPAVSSTGDRTLSFQVEDAATRLRATATLNASTGDGSWRIEEGRIEVGPWLTALAPLLGKDMAGLSGEGVVVITGEGLIRQGRPSGLAKISWSDGGVKHAGQGWTLDGVAVGAEVDVATLPDGAIPVTLAVRTISTARFGARNLAVSAVLNGTREIAVKSAGIEIAGGTVETDPFAVRLSPPSLNVQLRMKRVGLQDLLLLVPTALAEARGRINGELKLSWSESGGVQVGVGVLSLDKIEPAMLRFNPSPGLITANLPAAILKHYPGLAKIETGESAMLAENLEVHLTPDGDDEGRSATVRIAGGPLNPSLKSPIDLAINIRGPLTPFFKFGSDSRLSGSKAK